MCCTLQRADATVQETAAVAVPSEQDANYFFEPLLRSLVLGMGAGMICETAHQLIKFMSLTDQMGTNIIDTIPDVTQKFAPMFALDHLVAV
eukprot:jgi/Chrzof1/11770/Cz06g09100.t1